ncbi:MAG: lipid-binding SYLF domain-containing protein [Steroidobacteraceae bacterium]
MPNTLRKIFTLGALLLAAAGTTVSHAQARQEARLLVASEILDELRNTPDQRIPELLLQRAYAVAVIPSVTKVAFFLGGRRGNGVMVVRDARGRFTNPVFMNLTGGSFGLQFGAQEADVVLVFTTRRGVEGLAGGKLTLGAGASVAAGPVGRSAEAAGGFNAEVYSYARARGLFAGLALDGTALTVDNNGNAEFYGRRGVLASDIMSGAVTKDSENVRRFLAAVAASTGEGAGAPARAAPATGATSDSAPAAAPAAGGGVRTFPMEDPTPGQEPPR